MTKNQNHKNMVKYVKLLILNDFFFGGDDRDRTDDLLHAMQALSQLSYIPTLAKREL